MGNIGICISACGLALCIYRSHHAERDDYDKLRRCCLGLGGAARHPG